MERNPDLAWRIPGTGEPGGCHLWGHTESDTDNHYIPLQSHHSAIFSHSGHVHRDTESPEHLAKVQFQTQHPHRGQGEAEAAGPAREARAREAGQGGWQVRPCLSYSI